MQGEAIPRQAHQFGRHPHLQADEAGTRRPAVHRHLLTKLSVPAELHGEIKFASVTKGKLQPDHCCAQAQPHLGCPGRCCLLFGSRLTVSFSFSTASLLGLEPAISSSEGGPGSSNITTNIDLFSEFFNNVFLLLLQLGWYLPPALEEP